MLVPVLVLFEQSAYSLAAGWHVGRGSVSMGVYV